MNATKTTTSHTPGPWYYRPEEPSVESQLQTGYNVLIAECRGSSSVPPDQARANARLIAAAPELLAALESIAGGHVDDIGTNRLGRVRIDVEAMQSIARAAIAKATGQA